MTSTKRTRLAGALAAGVVGATLLAALPASASTGGSGGPVTDLRHQSFTASNGLTSQYHIFSGGVATDRPVGLLLQFHGDGAYEFKHPDSSYSLGGPSGIVAAAKQRDLLPIAVLSPDKQGTVTWWEDGNANADFVRDLVQEVAFGRYNIDTDNIWLVGYSGGAQFITQFFLPKHSGLVDGGGSIVFGGGGAPRVTPRPFAASLTDDFRMHWYTGLADDGSGGSYNALADARRGSEWYAARGFPVTLETPAGVGHGNLPFGTVVRQRLAPLSGSPTTAPPQPAARPEAPAGLQHTVTATRTGARLTVSVPAGTSRTTFRVSKSPFGTQTGWYTFTRRTGPEVTMGIRSNLTAGTPYYYQVERGTQRDVVARGTFTTAP